jgi:O-succinylbenzoic acid--CoA ligase
MSIPLKLVAANDTVGATIALADALAGTQAVFITPPEVNGLMPQVHGLPNEVPDHIALIVESSGSTGTPKQIWLSRNALLASSAASDAALGGPGQWLLALPANYIAGANVLLRSLAANTQPVLMNTALPFTPEAFALSASFMTGERRYVSLVPTQLNRLVSAAAIDDFLLAKLRRFNAILVGGQALDQGLRTRAEELGLNLVRSYGSAETAGGVVYNGLPLAGVQVRTNGHGALEISSPTLAEGLDPWYTTSDLGEIAPDGSVTVLGRTNRVLNSGGLKASLDAVEAVVLKIGGVVEAAAIAVNHPTWGERAAVVYVGSPEVADYVAADVFDALGAAAKPIRVVRVDAIPRLANGKTDYLSLQETFAE